MRPAHWFVACALLPTLGCSAGGSTPPAGSGSGAQGNTPVDIGGSSSAGPELDGGVVVDDGALGCKTTLSGTIYDPAGQLPLFNVVVYVPGAALEPISEGAACETCDGNFSGEPLAASSSDAAGKFSLELDAVALRENVPLVVQIGKWRRELSVPSIVECADNPLEDGLVRLPRD